MNWIKSFLRPSVLTPSSSLNQGDSVNRSVYVFGTFNPTANTLQLISFGHSGTLRLLNAFSTTTGLNLVTLSSVGEDALQAVHVFRAMKSSGLSPGTISFTLSGSASRGIVTITEISGTDITGVDGGGAIVQTTSSISDVSQSTEQLFLPNPIGAGNGTFGFFQVSQNTNFSPGSGYTEITDIASPLAEAQTNEVEWRADGQQTVNATSAVTGFWAAAAVEVKIASAAAVTVKTITQHLTMMGMGR